ncbi:Cysteine desulfurase [compost metagenome]
MKISYFDNAATTKVDERVLDKMIPFYLTEYGNPSSIYSIGRSSKRAIDEARTEVANLIGAKPQEIFFTGCGSESDNMAIKGIAFANRNKGNHIITTKIEHSAILESCKTLEKMGFEVTYLNVDKDGFIYLDELERSIRPTTILISIMLANNEIGTIEPIKQAAAIAKKYNVYFHTDAVQAIGNINIDVNDLGVDLLSMSSHKIYAPKGTGAIYIKTGVNINRFLDGGHQEKGRRAGTENVAGIVGLGEACRLARVNLEQHMDKVRRLNIYFMKNLYELIDGVRVNGSTKFRLPGNLNISIKGIVGETLMLKLDQRGICISTGSACNTGQTLPSHVLHAIGLNEEDIQSSVRITFGNFNTKEEVDYLLTSIVEIVKELREERRVRNYR